MPNPTSGGFVGEKQRKSEAQQKPPRGRGRAVTGSFDLGLTYGEKLLPFDNSLENARFFDDPVELRCPDWTVCLFRAVK
jgi:hypothetical protein